MNIKLKKKEKLDFAIRLKVFESTLAILSRILAIQQNTFMQKWSHKTNTHVCYGLWTIASVKSAMHCIFA